MSEPVHVFSNGDEYRAFVVHNCDHCTLCDRRGFPGECEIDGALGIALFGDGTVTAEIAQRMGRTDNPGALVWDCPERVDR